MQVYEVQKAFGLENLVLAERPDPEPGPGQVVVRIAAVSLNYRDLLMVQGKYNPRQPLPLVPLSDGAGRVAAVGEGVLRVKAGDRVAVTFFARWLAGRPSKEILRDSRGGPLDGTLAQSVLVSEDEVVRVPDPLTDEEAATLPCAALTAWSALVEEGGLLPGQSVLVQGTGGVSVFALQFARMLGAEVVATSSSDEKLERLRALGAHHTINYRSTPEWGRRVVELTGGNGVDHVVDVGGAATLSQSIHAVRVGGTISLIGNLGGAEATFNVLRVLMRQVRLQGIIVGHREGFERMNRAIALHAMRPQVGQVFEFHQVREAFQTMAAEKHFGKIVVRVS
jgi:NADPH:quinone reductase-like Zn-dependent oxidoreductase